MKIHRVTAVYISPTGGTGSVAEKTARFAAEQLQIPLSIADITLPGCPVRSFSADDLVIVASPVYAGRLPNKLLDRFETLYGNGAAAAAIAVCGGRDYGDALSELKGVLISRGFRVTAAAAFIARHAFSDGISPGRPDDSDISLMRRFARELVKKTESGETATVEVPGAYPPGPYYAPLKEDGAPAVFLKAKPVTNGALCNRCNQCIGVCPMSSIKKDASGIITEGVCIKCQACIRACPRHARSFIDPDFLSHVTMLKRTVGDRREPELFF